MLKIQKNGKLILCNYPKDIEVKSLIDHLCEPVVLEDGFTLKDLFSIIKETETDLIEKVFGSFLGHYPLKSFIDEAIDGETVIDNDPDKLVEITLTWNSFIVEDTTEFQLYTHMHLTGESSTYSTAFVKLNEIRDLPIILNKKIDMCVESEDSNKHKILFSREMEFTVYDLLRTILYEISFYGGPSERDSMAKSLLENMSEDGCEMKDNETMEDFLKRALEEEENEK